MNPDRTTILPRSRGQYLTLRSLPGWLVSLAVHGLLGICLLCGFDRPGLPDGSKAPGELLTLIAKFERERPPEAENGSHFIVPAEDEPPSQPVQSDAAVSEQSDSRPDEVQELPADTLPAETEMPETSEPPAIDPETATDEGPAVPLQLPQSRAIRRTPAPNWRTRLAALTASEQPGNAETLGEDEGAGGGIQFGKADGTSFFQINAQGNLFCYVVDCSSSMEEDNAIDVARTELMASLERLDPSRKFQILFYDAELHPLTQGTQSTFSATNAHRKLARQFMLGQHPSGGTRHKPALLAALKSAADVIFFLTDGATPELFARDLQDLKTLNRQRQQIHVIEFGKGAKLGTNWLDDLARDHRGTYRYRDVASE